MNKLITSTLFCALAALAGCSTTADNVSRSSSADMDSPTASNMPSATGQCDADPAQSMLGKSFNRGLLDQAKQLSGAAIVRTLLPGQLVTMEYNPQRFNLLIDEDNKIIRANCG